MIATIKKWWIGHGTKILGVITTLVGAAGETLSYIQAVDQKHAALWAMIIMLGGSILRRGFTNTANSPDILPPPVAR